MNPPPSSRRPAGMPDSGNVKYAIAAIGFLVASGALFAWRSCSRSEAVATVPPVPSLTASAPPVNPKLDDIPLPPPPEDKPVPGTGPKVIYTTVAGGCDGKCSQQYSTPELGQALQVRAGQARRCYNQALSQDSTLKGHVSINVRIGPSGNVCSATVGANDMGSPAVANCAANVFRATSGYPAPRGGCVDANVPLNFKPQGQ
ncbi:MAG: AgmX/PglI C-terminal domain-containing protein [Polyangiaceae bacterium]